MTWWQIALAVWFGGWAILFAGLQILAPNQPIDHGKAALALFWPVYLLWVPVAALIGGVGSVLLNLACALLGHRWEPFQPHHNVAARRCERCGLYEDFGR